MLKYVKVRNVKSPVRANPGDAGIDFYIPEKLCIDDVEGSDYSIDDERMVIFPSGRIKIPTGIHVSLPKNDDGSPKYALIAFNKSGVGFKNGVIKVTEVVDDGYQGEIFVGVSNISKSNQEFKFGTKLIQFALVPIGFSELSEISTIGELYAEKSTRGSGALGSTGVN